MSADGVLENFCFQRGADLETKGLWASFNSAIEYSFIIMFTGIGFSDMIGYARVLFWELRTGFLCLAKCQFPCK
jgi:hypothetical protein